MNALLKAKSAYSAVSAPLQTSRGSEYRAVAQITHRLRSASQKGQAGFPDLVQAMHDNKRLWNIFAIDVADAANPLPADLRARLFYLAEFTNQHTSKVLARTASVEPLIEINSAVMRGLRGEGN